MNTFLSESSALQIFLFVLFLLSLAIQFGYYLLVYIRIGLKKNTALGSGFEYPPLSVVICARNEEANLEAFLPSILEQEYPEFEVVVVNDCSFDNSDMVLKRLQQKHQHLRFTTIKQDDKFLHGKKLALTVGIKAAKNEWLVLTDADCQPQGKEWLKKISSNFNENTELVLGYGGYISEKGFLNQLIRFDAFFIAVNYLSFALMGKPYMGVGRNLAYRRELFFRNKGFASHISLLSGDDDLFVHEVANRRNTAVEYCSGSHTLSVPRKSFAGWLTQKKRHLTTGSCYTANFRFLLLLEPITRLLFWAGGIWLALTLPNPWIIGGAMAGRLLTLYIVLRVAQRRLEEDRFFLIAFLYDILSPLLYFWLTVTNKINTKKYKWS